MPFRPKPLLLYDGECGFCRRWVERWRALTGDRVDYAPYQEVADQFPQIPKERFEQSVQLIEPASRIDPDGRVSQGAEAVFRTLAVVPGKGWPLWVYQRIPGAAPIAEWAYRFVARHRRGLLPAAQCPAGPPITYLETRWRFLRALGLIYGIAFLSLWTQVEGLIGSNGILPVTEFLDRVREMFGAQGYRLLPTLFWLNGSDLALHWVCGAGVLLSILLILKIGPAICLVSLWVLYLSLTTVGREFMGFQWDALLLETGFLAIFLAPLSLRPRIGKGPPPSPVVIGLLRWLLFRLMISSAIVKWGSGDPTWRNLTALAFHYETQPLPNLVSWYVHQLPVWFQVFSAAGMFAIEGLVPFLIFGGRRARFFGFWILVGFQGLILLTGNYCFFNLLTIALCFLLLDDGAWRRGRESPFALSRPSSFDYAQDERPSRRTNRPGSWPSWLIAPLAAVILPVSTVETVSRFRIDIRWPGPVQRIVEWVDPFRSINAYGLFAVMTMSRPEIIVEGSNDQATWKAYEFKYKPGDPARPPRFNIPHQPRLDWQLWFAALGSYRENPWFIQFCGRLLEGSPEVLNLLKGNPFPDAPPKYIRAVLVEYRFTDFPTRRATGNWWRRQLKGLYCPVLSLREN